MAKGETILHAFQQLMYTYKLRHQWRSAREVHLGVAATLKRPSQAINNTTQCLGLDLVGLKERAIVPFLQWPHMGNSQMARTNYWRVGGSPVQCSL